MSTCAIPFEPAKLHPVERWLAFALALNHNTSVLKQMP